MPGSVVLSGLSPHPPIIVPEVGRGGEKPARKTCEAMERLAKAFAGAEYDTLVLITPHGPVFSDVLSVRYDKLLSGDLSSFGAPEVEGRFPNDQELAQAIIEEAEKGSRVTVIRLDDRNLWRYGIQTGLDHGSLVPLSYLKKQGFTKKLLVVNIGFLPHLELYLFGKDIEKAARKLGRRIAVLASGDLSHRLKPGAPAGFNVRGKEFDERLVSCLSSWDVRGVLFLPPDLIEDAGECGLRPISIMLGTLDEAEVEAEIFSYEGPFGVGYSVGLFTPKRWAQEFSKVSSLLATREEKMRELREGESWPVRLARTTVERFIRRKKVPPVPEDVPQEFQRRAGVFVSIHKEGALRGCIGTTEATKDSIPEEIISNAISAATADPRFSPITGDELDLLDYSVDILSEATPVEDLSCLDPKKYGVIVEKGSRRGLLLPDLPGVDSVEEQLSIAKRKAGISLSEKGVRVKKFTVQRYH